MANFSIVYEVNQGKESDWNLCFQWGEYKYDDGNMDTGYRFIWRKPDGSLQAARGQARIPNAAIMFDLIRKASEEGWLVSVERLDL